MTGRLENSGSSVGLAPRNALVVIDDTDGRLAANTLSRAW